MSSKQPLLSIVIVSFNTKDLLKRCLNSIFTSSKGTTFEAIVVDNASSDGSLEMIHSDFPKVKIIVNTVNKGFGTANNQGVRKATGEWILLLNSDTRLNENTLDSLFQKITEMKSSNAALGCMLLNPDDSIQPSAGYFPTIGRVTAQMLFVDDLPLMKKVLKPYQQTDTDFYNHEQEVDWVTGAFFLVSKDMFQKVGGFDENIFMYGEEVDLCYRLKQQGVKVIYTPKAKIYHDKGASSVDGFTAAITGEYRGLKTIYQKYYPHFIGILKIVLAVGALLRLGVFGMIRRNQSAAYRKAFTTLFS